jgi:hypothetical protein
VEVVLGWRRWWGVDEVHVRLLLYSAMRWTATATSRDTLLRALFSSPKNLKCFQDFPSHRILRHIYEILNVDKNNN